MLKEGLALIIVEAKHYSFGLLLREILGECA
jgi:hypothetical protein